MKGADAKYYASKIYEAAEQAARWLNCRLRAGVICVVNEAKSSPFSVLLFVATTVYTLFAALQWEATRESFTAVQRAFVYASDLRLTPRRSQDGKLQYWRVSLFLENGGTTPTRGMKWVIQPMYGPPVSPETNEVAIPFSAANQGSLGPKARFIFFDTIIDRSAEERIMKGSPLFLLGKATYFDAFSRDPHITRFCFQIYGPPWISEATSDMLIDEIDLASNVCRHNNCADDECKAQEQPHGSAPAP